MAKEGRQRDSEGELRNFTLSKLFLATKHWLYNMKLPTEQEGELLLGTYTFTQIAYIEHWKNSLPRNLNPLNSLPTRRWKDEKMENGA